MTYKLLAETYSLTWYFRSILNIPYSFEIINFLLKNSKLSIWDLETRWDSFDKVFWKEYWSKISALSFATIIEARWALLNSIIEKKLDKNNLIIELASGFTPRGLNFVNSWKKRYIETDKKSVIELKKDFYSYLHSIWKETPKLEAIDVIKKEDLKILYNIIKIHKLENSDLTTVTLISEWLIIYLSKEDQKIFFDNMRFLWSLLKDIGITLKYLTIDMPTHENFTNWLVHEDFNLKDHLEVMSKVDPQIIDSLFNTENDFISQNSLPKFIKYNYSDEIITSLKTPKLPKYKKIENLRDKINIFLKQEILFAWEIEL